MDPNEEAQGQDGQGEDPHGDDGFIEALVSALPPDEGTQTEPIGDNDDDNELPAGEEAARTPDSQDTTAPAGDDDDGPAEQGDDIASLKAQLDNLTKRFTDTQRSYHQERQARLDLEKRLGSVAPQSPDGQPAGDGDAEESYLTPREREMLADVKEVKRMLREQQEQQAVAAWDRAADKVRGKHDDFDDAVAQFQSAWESDAAGIRDEFAKDGGTPEAAYRIGSRLRDTAEMLKDPQAYREKLKAEILAEAGQNGNNGGGHPQQHKLAGRTSRGPARTPVQDPSEDDVLDQTLREIGGAGYARQS